MNYFQFFIVTSFSFILYGCNILDALNGEDENAKQIIIVDMSPQDANFDIDPFFIKSAEISNNILKLKFSYVGGCKKHEFTLYGAKAEWFSIPPQRDIWLSHQANDDNCEATITKTISFDLSPLKGERIHGQFLLRIYEYGYKHGESEPIYPQPSYNF